MNTRLVIAADLGLLRAYREFKRRQDREPHLELILEIKLQAAREKLSEQVTHQAGRFPKHAQPGQVHGNLSAHERGSLDAEEQRRLLKRLAGTINDLLTVEMVEDCRLAVSAPIHRQLLDALDSRARRKVSQVIPSDLARSDPKDLAQRFMEAGTAKDSSERGRNSS